MITGKQRSAITAVLIATMFSPPALAWQSPVAEPRAAQAAKPAHSLGTYTEDEIVVYGEDLSRLHVSDDRTTKTPPVPLSPGQAKSPPPALPLTPGQLRALFHRPEFNRLDGLAAYHDDPAWRSRGATVRPALASSEQPAR